MFHKGLLGNSALPEIVGPEMPKWVSWWFDFTGVRCPHCSPKLLLLPAVLYKSGKWCPCYYKSQDVLISCIPRLMDFHPLNSKQNAFMCIRLGPTLHSNYSLVTKSWEQWPPGYKLQTLYYYYVSLILVATGRTRIMLILLPCDIAGNYGVSLHLQFILPNTYYIY